MHCVRGGSRVCDAPRRHRPDRVFPFQDNALARRPVMAVLNVNGKSVQANADPRTPLLWVLRDTLGMTGTKYGCGIAQCGACTVHIDGVATRSCQVPLSATNGKKIVTIEGLAQDGKLNKIQQA